MLKFLSPPLNAGFAGVAIPVDETRTVLVGD